MLKQNAAQIDSLTKVQNSQSNAYANLKSKLSLTNTDLLNFIKTKLIKTYEGKDMALNIQSPERTK
jgi:hypothetical protein